MNQIRQRFDDVEERLEDRFNDAEVDRDDIWNMLSQLQRQTLLVLYGAGRLHTATFVQVAKSVLAKFFKSTLTQVKICGES